MWCVRSSTSAGKQAFARAAALKSGQVKVRTPAPGPARSCQVVCGGVPPREADAGARRAQESGQVKVRTPAPGSARGCQVACEGVTSAGSRRRRARRRSKKRTG
jgi:hypothetical protein